MIAHMAKKKPSTDRHRGKSVLLRFADQRLLDALDAYALRERRPRTQSIILLLEQALKAHGLWPPPAADKS